MPEVTETPTYNINGVEVFSSGVWNKDKYEVEDLHNLVTAFNSLKGGFKPFLKLGHDNSQKLAKSSGLPSVGWVENLYVRGTKLFADFNYVPKKIFELIKKRAYRKVSCEIYWDLDVDGIKYPRVLSAIALLGAETPGVMNLADILGNYTCLENKRVGVFEAMTNEDSLKAYQVNLEQKTEEDEMSDENKEMEKELEEKKSYAAKLVSEKSELEKTVAEQTAEIAKFRAEAEKAQAAEKEAKISKFITELEAKKLVTPSMKDHMSQLLSDKKEYTLKEKPVSREEILTELLTLSQENAKVNFTESSRADFAKAKDKDEEMDKKIEKYAKDNKVDYASAYKAVMKGMPMKDEEEEK